VISGPERNKVKLYIIATLPFIVPPEAVRGEDYDVHCLINGTDVYLQADTKVTDLWFNFRKSPAAGTISLSVDRQRTYLARAMLHCVIHGNARKTKLYGPSVKYSNLCYIYEYEK
jgi:hypothetical protein